MLAELADLRRRLESSEAARKQIEDELEHILEHTPVLLCIAGVDGYYKRVNPAFERILGHSEEESLSRPFLEFIHPDDRPIARANLERLAAGESLVNFEDRNVCKDGSYRWLSWTVVPWPEKGLVYGIGYDVTARKAAEEGLQEAQRELERRFRERTAELAEANRKLREKGEQAALFRKFAEASTQGLGMADLDGRITYANPALCRLIGEDRPEDVVGKNFLTYYEGAARSRLQDEIIPKVLQSGQWTGEKEVVARDGRRTATLQNCFLIRDNEGNPTHFADVVTDITDRKEAEEAMRRDHQMLTRLVAAHDHERRLISYEIHDGLAQQLTAAIMQFQVLEQMGEPIPEAVLKLCGGIEDLLQAALAEARRLIRGGRPPILDEAGLVTAIQNLAHEINSEHGPDIEVHTDVRFGRLEPMLENALYRIAQESVANACRHSKSDRIELRLVQIGDRVRIETQDWGVGFDPQTVDENRFGLAGIRERARLLGGEATIQSAPGQGTRVTVELPLAVRDEE